MNEFIDTSAIFALVDDSADIHVAAMDHLQSISDGRLVTHVAVVIESTALLDRRFGPAATTQFLSQLLPTIAVFHGTELTYERALATYRIGTGRRRPSLTDCFAFETMRELHLDAAFTFDDHFARAGFTVVPGD
jgi:predicted nucleic acid-binding protein